MVFGLPISVGVTSEAEYADFETTVEVQPEEFIERLNAELPAGLKLTAARPKKAGGNIMASISAALYEITLILEEEMQQEGFDARLMDYLGRSTITARKEGKNGAKDIDIRPMIRQLKVERLEKLPPGYEGFKAACKLTALLDAGSVSNLKPELVAVSMKELEGLKTGAVRIHRKELYVGSAGRLESPLNGI
jgi:radical SAM-linked protein